MTREGMGNLLPNTSYPRGTEAGALGEEGQGLKRMLKVISLSPVFKLHYDLLKNFTYGVMREGVQVSGTATRVLGSILPFSLDS